jgi:hypothetical protein
MAREARVIRFVCSVAEKFLMMLLRGVEEADDTVASGEYAAIHFS